MWENNLPLLISRPLAFSQPHYAPFFIAYTVYQISLKHGITEAAFFRPFSQTETHMHAVGPDLVFHHRVSSLLRRWGAARCTPAPRMSWPMKTSTKRTPSWSTTASRGSEPPRTAARSDVSSTGRRPHTSTAGEPTSWCGWYSEYWFIFNCNRKTIATLHWKRWLKKCYYCYHNKCDILTNNCDRYKNANTKD